MDDLPKKKLGRGDLYRQVASWKTAVPTSQKMIGGKRDPVESKPPVIDPKEAVEKRRRLFALVDHWKKHPPTNDRMIGGKIPHR